MPNRTVLAAVAMLLVITATPLLAQEVLTAPTGEFMPYAYDSGTWDNDRSALASVLRYTVSVPGAAWIRVYFDEVTLAPGSTLVVTSLFDLEMQHLDARSAREWRNTSAYFNGDAVELELLAGPNTRGNRFVIREVAVQMATGWTAGQLCGVCADDDRIPSEERWAGRMMPVGCTGSLYNPAGCLVTAGHCLGFAFVMEFQVPLSFPDGSLRHPGPRDQYPIDENTITGLNEGVGRDWGYFNCSPNSETRLLAIEGQGEFRPIAPELPSAFPVEAEVFGYGVSETGTLSQAQKRGAGPLIDLQGGFGSQDPAWYHEADTTGGNSGSAILHAGEIIGIVTHCTVGCPNLGTPIDRPDFVEARESCPAQRGDCDGDEDIDSVDLAAFVDCLTGPRNGPPAAGCGCVNYRTDSHIDLRDIWVAQNAAGLNLCVVPSFVEAPQSQPVCPGDSVALRGEVFATRDVAYQWLRNGEPIEGATSPDLVIDAVTVDDLAEYRLRATVICGESISPPAELVPCLSTPFSDDFEADLGWEVTSPPDMVRGEWFRAAPQGTFNQYVDVITQPGFDNPLGLGTKCFATGPFTGDATANDVDGGPTVLTSPLINVPQADRVVLRYAHWFYRDNEDGDDALLVEASTDGGQSWQLLARHSATQTQWQTEIVDLSNALGVFDSLRIRFVAEDALGETIVEAAVDDIRIVTSE